MTILVAADFDAAEWAQWRDALQAELPRERFVRDACDGPPQAIDIALVANPPSGSLAALPALQLVQSLWAGVDRLLADATLPVDVPLARMVDPAMNAAMAETALWAVLGLQRGFFRYAEQQRAGLWQPLGFRRADEVEVAVLGLGQMGRAVARRLAQHGCRVTAWSRRGEPVDGIDLRSGDAALHVLLAHAEVVVNLLPLTPATRGLFDATTLAAMRRGASLVNLARGAHVVESDLLAAIDRGHIAHAVLDVFATEPLPPSHRFWSHPSVTVLPHVAAPTDPRSAAAVAADNVRTLRDGRPVKHRVDRASGY